MIGQDLQEDLNEVLVELERIGTEHRRCLSCHCYREVAEEMGDALQIVLGHAESSQGRPIYADLTQGGERLRELLDSSEGTHG